jgi:hypothetical protein
MTPPSSFDPTSPEYQVSDQYLPDKESSWHHKPEEDGWVLDHNAVRGQMLMIREALELIQSRRNQPLVEWEISALVQAFDHHYELVHKHHSNEDDIFTPALKKRFKYPEKVCVCVCV